MLDVNKMLAALPHHTPVYGAPAWVADPNLYPVYARLFRALDPTSLFEIGTLVGYSLATAVYAVPGLTRVEFVDTEMALPGSNQMARENVFSAEAVRRHGFDRWQFETTCSDLRVRARTTPPTPAEVLAGYTPDVVHVDARHEYEHCLGDLEYARTLNPRWVVGHDYDLPAPFGVERAVKEFCGKYGLPHLYVPLTFGAYAIPLRGNDILPVADAIGVEGVRVCR